LEAKIEFKENLVKQANEEKRKLDQQAKDNKTLIKSQESKIEELTCHHEKQHKQTKEEIDKLLHLKDHDANQHAYDLESMQNDIRKEVNQCQAEL
jgi:hypothetical protein